MLGEIVMKRHMLDFCFPAGTFVLTRSGFRPIESVQVGDFVYTHRGRWRRVTAVMKREVASVYRVKVVGLPLVYATPEHPFLAYRIQRKWDSTKRGYCRSVAEGPSWRTVEELAQKGNDSSSISWWVVSPSFRGRFKPYFSGTFWWVVGRYVANGWIQDYPRYCYGVAISIIKAEAKEFEKRLQEVGLRYSRAEGQTVVEFTVRSRWFTRFMLKFGQRSHEKRIPGFIFELADCDLNAFLDGYLSDYRRRGVVRINTASKALALSLYLLFMRRLGVPPHCMKGYIPPRTAIKGRVINQQDFWVVSLPKTNKTQRLVFNGEVLSQVKAVEFVGYYPVYNLSVEEDESYVAEGLVVHNCQPVSSS